MIKIFQRIYSFPPFMFLVHQNQYVAKQVTEFKPNLRLCKKVPTSEANNKSKKYISSLNEFIDNKQCFCQAINARHKKL